MALSVTAVTKGIVHRLVGAARVSVGAVVDDMLTGADETAVADAGIEANAVAGATTADGRVADGVTSAAGVASAGVKWRSSTQRSRQLKRVWILW